MEVQDLQSILELLMKNSQQEVPSNKVHPQYTSPLWRSDRVHYAPLRYGFIIENDNKINIIHDDDPLTYSEAVMSKDADKWLNTVKLK